MMYGPINFGMTPNGYGMAPNNNGMVPMNNGMAPYNFGMVPNGFGMVPNGFNMPPMGMWTNNNWQNPQAFFESQAQQQMNNQATYGENQPSQQQEEVADIDDIKPIRNLLDPQQYKNVKISEKDLMTIVAKYGDNIDTIYDLNPGESLYFDKAVIHHQMQLLQFAWRVKIEANPAKFRLCVDEICNKMDNLRVAYAYRDLEHPYKVLLKKRIAKIYFRDDRTINITDKNKASDLNEIMERDRALDFDLEEDPLLRITVFKQHKKDDFIILFSQPHINTDGTTLTMFMKNLLQALGAEPEELSDLVKENKIQNYQDYIKTIDKNAELSYWKEYFKGFGKVKTIPGYIADNPVYVATSYKKKIPKSICDGLRSIQGELKVTTFTIMQTIWALLLGSITNSNDVSFGTIVSGRDFNFLESLQVGGELSNLIPLRVKWEKTETVGDVIKQFQINFLNSTKNSHCSMTEIMEVLGRKTPLINHVLNYENLPITDDNKYTPEDGGNFKLLSTVVSIGSMEDLNVLFFNEKEGMRCEYHYNVNSFSKESIELISRYFNANLKLIAESGVDIRCEELPKINADELRIASEAKKYEVYKKARFFKEALYTYGLKEKELMYLANNSPHWYYNNGRVIIERNSKIDSIPVIISGSAEIYQQTLDGWSAAIAVCGPGKILSFAGLSKQPSKETIVSSSDDTEVVFVPIEVERTVWERNPELLHSLFAILEEKYIGYSKLWIDKDVQRKQN